ncbi:carbon storage regulator [Legionella sp. 16cNR16C]|uniref:carbon storage regulator n=1 Tax=Legionella sp. 16cNR16C TaxID=2905656 RepID=UPI001E56DA50|nr:carbon storage regulator [Legionella sp. 16cNR16C]MCE3043980.1 carbon storage regulator [Legionella sp. 16cNR16C]
MLILGRREGELILIDKGQIQLKVLHLDSDLIHLGIKSSTRIDIDTPAEGTQFIKTDSMLVLQCRLGDKLFLNNSQIQVKLLAAHHGIVYLGIQAPVHIDVDREEIFARKMATARLSEKACNDVYFKKPNVR